jgi:predicted negative regulator of RcsB-dependent stress response
MPLSARQLLTKALHLLDRGDIEGGEAALRQAVASSVEAADSVTTVAALCCLGELLIEQGRRTEATATLRACLAVPVPDDLAEVCTAERTTARQLLADIT